MLAAGSVGLPIRLMVMEMVCTSMDASREDVQETDNTNVVACAPKWCAALRMIIGRVEEEEGLKKRRGEVR
jgi:hypothetical protein